MRTKHLFVLIHIGYEGDVGTVEHVLALQYFFTDRSKTVLLLWVLLITCVSCLSVILSCLFLAAL